MESAQTERGLVRRIRSMNRALLVVLSTLALPAYGSAQADEPPLAGHSNHGEAFNEGPRQKAYLMGNTGKVDFPVTTTSGLAQKFINQGIGQLHGYWYFEAERSFRQAARLDPDCAMAYWGMTLANVDNDEEKRFQLVGEDEADIKSGRLSIGSPIARALVGKEEGDVVEVNTPGGKLTYEITSVEYG